MVSKKLFFAASFGTLLLFAASFVFAREVEVRLPGQDWAQGALPLLPEYVKSLFKFALIISGAIVGGVIFFAGVKLVTSAQNPASLSDARARILDGVVGAVVIFGAYLLLAAINPQLILIDPELKGANFGVTLYEDAAAADGSVKTIQKTFTSSQASFEAGFVPTRYRLNTSSAYLNAYAYSGPSYSSTKILLPECKNNGGICEIPLSAQSIEMEYRYPGVYLCKQDGAKDTCVVYNSSSAQIDKNLEGKVYRIIIKNSFTYDDAISREDCLKKPGGFFWEQNNPDNPSGKSTCQYDVGQYGAVLHEKKNFTGTCKEYLTGSPASGAVSSITVFLQGAGDSEGGVTLYKEQDYRETLVKNSEEKKIFYFFPYSPSPRKYENFNNNYYEDNTPVNNHVLSIKIKGSYMALLFQDTNFQNKCEVITSDDRNLGIDNPVGENVSSLKIIPIKK
ncbi:MAG: hypothetical protein V1705_00010 [bacterium]